MRGQPAHAIEHRCPAVCAPLGLMHGHRVVIDAHADRKSVAIGHAQAQQFSFMPAHGFHRVGQHQHGKAARQKALRSKR